MRMAETGSEVDFLTKHWLQILSNVSEIGVEIALSPSGGLASALTFRLLCYHKVSMQHLPLHLLFESSIDVWSMRNMGLSIHQPLDLQIFAAIHVNMYLLFVNFLQNIMFSTSFWNKGVLLPTVRFHRYCSYFALNIQPSISIKWGVSVYVDRASTTYYQVLTWKWHAVVLLYLQKFGQMLSSCLYALFKSTVHSSGHCLILVASVSLGYSSVSTVTSFWLDHQGSISRTGQGYFIRLLAQTNFRIHTALSPIYCTLGTLHTEARLSTHHYLVPKLRIYGAEPPFSIGPRGMVFKLGT